MKYLLLDAIILSFNPINNLNVLKMRKLLQVILSFTLAMCVLFTISFIFTEMQILSPEDQAQLKAGKNFWNWDSPKGQYAMHYIEKGSGPHHVILLHGFRANTFTWRYMIDPLAEAGFHVWAIDLLGYGFSDKPSDAQYTMDFFLEQINAFMEGQEITKAHFVGSSMGGGLSLSMSLYHPHRVDSLSLIDALGYPLDLPFAVTVGKHLGHLWLPFLGPTMVRKGLQQVVYNHEKITPDQIHAYSLPYCFPGGATASLNTLNNFDNQQLKDLSERYKHEITYPLLIVWGMQDTLIPFHHYEKFCQDFPAAKTVLIPQCGHIPQEEKPEVVQTALIEFLTHVTQNR